MNVYLKRIGKDYLLFWEKLERQFKRLAYLIEGNLKFTNKTIS